MRFTQRTDVQGETATDAKDRKILSLLSQNARTPFTILSRKVGLSKDSVRYRVARLEKRGIIQGCTTQVDTSRLGFDSYHLFFRLKKPGDEERIRLIMKIKQYPFVKVIIEFSGRYDLEVGVVARSIGELDRIIALLMADFYPSVEECLLLILAKNYISRVLPLSFTRMQDSRTDIEKQKAWPDDLRPDKTDLGLLSIISKDASLPLHKIGSKLGLSGDAVRYRLRKLSEGKIILGYRPIINYSALGYTVYVVLMNITGLDSAKEKRLASHLRLNESVFWAVKTIGTYNLLAYLCVRKSEEFHQAIISLRNMFASDIRDFETLVAYEEHVYTYFPEMCISGDL